MREKPLLLPSAKSAVVYVNDGQPRWARLVRYAALCIGLLCVLVGAADITARLSRLAGPDANLVAFGPAVALDTQIAATSTPGIITPARLRIPSLSVSANVEAVGKKADGTMGTPTEFMDVAWYGLGAKPGETGNAVFAGHVNNALTKAGVFENLSKVHVGDYVTVSDESGRTLVYKVSDVKRYPVDQAPEASIFSTAGPSQLVLITCDGDWVPDEHSFDQRLVVVAKPAY